MLNLQVHSTIENAILPSATQYGSSDDVLSWLDETLTAIWVDPVCGDGVCETPFEYASYGRFGCRADCGKLSEIQNLTTLQIDLYFDFDHPTTSIASSVCCCENAALCIDDAPSQSLLPTAELDAVCVCVCYIPDAVDLLKTALSEMVSVAVQPQGQDRLPMTLSKCLHLMKSAQTKNQHKYSS